MQASYDGVPGRIEQEFTEATEGWELGIKKRRAEGRGMLSKCGEGTEVELVR
jgi:hypothetical protein